MRATLSKAICLALCVLQVTSENTKLKEIFSWKTVDYEWADAKDREAAVKSGEFIPNHNLPLGLEVWKDKLFITVPRWKNGVVSTLNYVKLNEDDICLPPPTDPPPTDPTDPTTDPTDPTDLTTAPPDPTFPTTDPTDPTIDPDTVFPPGDDPTAPTFDIGEITATDPDTTTPPAETDFTATIIGLRSRKARAAAAEDESGEKKDKKKKKKKKGRDEEEVKEKKKKKGKEEKEKKKKKSKEGETGVTKKKPKKDAEKVEPAVKPDRKPKKSKKEKGEEKKDKKKKKKKKEKEEDCDDDCEDDCDDDCKDDCDDDCKDDCDDDCKDDCEDDCKDDCEDDCKDDCDDDCKDDCDDDCKDCDDATPAPTDAPTPTPDPCTSRSPALIPYPSFKANSLDPEKRDDTSITSVFRVRADACDRLWVMDTGVADILGETSVVSPPRILIFNLNDDTLIRSYDFKPSDSKENSFYANIIVDANPSDCEKTFAYVPDLGGYGIVVYDYAKNDSWRIKHNYFHFDPLAGNMTVGGVDFQWTDGVFSIALTKPQEDGFRTAYFHALASTKEFQVNTKTLQTPDQTKVGFFDFHVVGDRGRESQSSASFIQEDTGVMFYTQLQKDGIYCWNTNKDLVEENLVEVASDNETMIFPNDLKVDAKGRLWLLTDRLPAFIYRGLTDDEINYRVFTAPVDEVIAGTKCAP